MGLITFKSIENGKLENKNYGVTLYPYVCPALDCKFWIQVLKT